MNKTELLIFLEKLQKRPNRALSQNFLIDNNIALKIVKTAQILPEDQVLEIGPGPGILTEHLLNAGAHVFAVEKDPLFAKELPRLQTKNKRLSIFQEDILAFDFAQFSFPMKVVSNLPYHITAPIFERLFAHKTLFSALTLMIQKEVGERLLAKPGTKQYGSFTLFTEFHAKITNTFTVSPTCFYPQPKVSSQVLRLATIPSRTEENELFSLIRSAFQKRRKMLRVSLKSLYPPQIIEKALLGISLPSTARPETLSLTQWIGFKSLIMNEL